METQDRFIRAKECARILAIGRSTWWNLVKKGCVEKGIHFGKRVTVWRLSTVLAFAERQKEAEAAA